MQCGHVRIFLEALAVHGVPSAALNETRKKGMQLFKYMSVRTNIHVSLSISSSKHKPVSLLSPLFILKKKQLNDINESYSTIPFFLAENDELIFL